MDTGLATVWPSALAQADITNRSCGAQGSSLGPFSSPFQAVITNRSLMTQEIKFLSILGLL